MQEEHSPDIYLLWKKYSDFFGTSFLNIQLHERKDLITTQQNTKKKSNFFKK